MVLTFAGTRGNIPARSRLHRHHSVLVVEGRRRVLVDCGLDWLGRCARLNPAAILITHAHEDHVDGLRAGADCAVYATAETWNALADWPLANRVVLPARREVRVAGLTVEAWPVEHSVRAPAVGYRLADRRARIFYVPDIAGLPAPHDALRDVDLYVGDGATLERSLVRVKEGHPTGHATVRAQLEWCAAAGVRRAMFTHCGSGIVREDPKDAEAAVRALGREHGVSAWLAIDGLRVRVKKGHDPSFPP